MFTCCSTPLLHHVLPSRNPETLFLLFPDHPQGIPRVLRRFSLESSKYADAEPMSQSHDGELNAHALAVSGHRRAASDKGNSPNMQQAGLLDIVVSSIL